MIRSMEEDRESWGKGRQRGWVVAGSGNEEPID